jgi:hypothetical protein
MKSLFVILFLPLLSHADDTVDTHFRAIASGTDEERRKAIALLYKWDTSEPDRHNYAVNVYLFGTRFVQKTGPLEEKPENYKVLLKAVPKLIDVIGTDQNKAAWRLLVHVMAYARPENTSRADWRKLWETQGRRRFETAAYRGEKPPP